MPDLVVTLTAPDEVKSLERSSEDWPKLEFINGAGRNVSSGGADGLVADVNSVHVNAGGSAETAAERNRRVTGLGGIEILTVLNLHAGFKLRQIQEVAAVHRQVRNLIRVQDALHLSLLGVDCDRAGLHFNDLALLAKLQLDIGGGSVAHFHCDCFV